LSSIPNSFIPNYYIGNDWRRYSVGFKKVNLTSRAMIRPMFGFRPKPKKFDLPFRYHDPEKEEREDNRRKRRIKFQTHNRVKPKQNVRVLALALLLSLVVYLITIL